MKYKGFCFFIGHEEYGIGIASLIAKPNMRLEFGDRP